MALNTLSASRGVRRPYVADTHNRNEVAFLIPQRDPILPEASTSDINSDTSKLMGMTEPIL